jgi:hypothetical protein
MNIIEVEKLFKQAYYYNWDNGIDLLNKILDDDNCDKATALMIFWDGSPDYYYNIKNKTDFSQYDKNHFKLLCKISEMVLNNAFPSFISYDPKKDATAQKKGNIPDYMYKPIVGEVDYKDILWPVENVDQDAIYKICSNCTSKKDMVELEERGVDFSKRILNGYSYPIQVSVNYGQVEAMKYFIEKNYNINKKYDKEPLLFKAISNKHINIIKLFIKNNAKLNITGQYKRNVFHHIASMVDFNGGFDNKMEEIATLFLHEGVDIWAKDVDKKTPLDLAEMWENIGFKKFIEKSLQNP